MCNNSVSGVPTLLLSCLIRFYWIICSQHLERWENWTKINCIQLWTTKSDYWKMCWWRWVIHSFNIPLRCGSSDMNEWTHPIRRLSCQHLQDGGLDTNDMCTVINIVLLNNYIGMQRYLKLTSRSAWLCEISLLYFARYKIYLCLENLLRDFIH